MADQLFENRPTFSEVLAAFPECHAIVPYLRTRAQDDSVERVLQRLRDEAGAYPERLRQLAGVRYYLQALLWKCEGAWMQVAKGVINHVTLVDQIRQWRLSAGPVGIVTFNYDTLIERALKGLNVRFSSPESYVADPVWKVFKLHGSINWGRRIRTPISMSGRGNGMEMAREIMSRAAEIQLTDEYRIIERLPEDEAPGPAWFPAISIPVQSKTEFECPSQHIEHLELLLGKVDRILIVGWKAAEDNFLSLLQTGLKARTRIMIVSGSHREAEETIRRLDALHLPAEFVPPVEGFTNFVTTRSIQRLLD